jgi:hypothetical protein
MPWYRDHLFLRRTLCCRARRLISLNLFHRRLSGRVECRRSADVVEVVLSRSCVENGRVRGVEKATATASIYSGRGRDILMHIHVAACASCECGLLFRGE